MKNILKKNTKAFKDLRENEKQAYFNEYKGLLFEFLVAQSVARWGQKEELFLKEIPEEYLNKLISYERSLRASSPVLLSSIQFLAKETSSPLLQSFDPLRPSDLVQVELMQGKATLSEADFVVQFQNERRPFSLKLSKAQAYVNTKSAGVMSVAQKYFKDFSDSMVWQEKINQEVHSAFLQMAFEFYELEGLEWPVMTKPFGKEWEEAGLPHLPGLLPARFHSALLHFYKRAADILLKAFLSFSKQNPVLFARSLLPLCGFGRSDLWQLSCFYSDGAKLHSITLEKAQDWAHKVESFIFVEKKPETGYFEIELLDYVLQIRIKPMNTFKTPSPKINCSLKYLVR